MSFEQFIEAVKNEVKELVGNQYTVSVNCVLKINQELQSLSILGNGAGTYPSIYLEDFYEEYRSGKLIQDIAVEIIKLADMRKQEFSDFSKNLRDFQWVKPRLRVKLINFHKNDKLLSTVPYEEFLDLAVIPYILIPCDYGMMTARVVNSLLEYWKVSAEEILKQAKDNTLCDNPVVVERMSEFIFNIMRKELKETDNEESKMLLDDFFRDDRPGMEMFILTNKSNIDGAFSAFYSNSLFDLADRTGNDLLYILPSSIHEILVIPTLGMELNKLHEMVREVNSTQVATEDYLSDSIYLYTKNLNNISIVS